MKKHSGNFLSVVILLLCLALVVFWIYTIITYGGKPITEIPSWAIPFIIGRRH